MHSACQERFEIGNAAASFGYSYFFSADLFVPGIVFSLVSAVHEDAVPLICTFHAPAVCFSDLKERSAVLETAGTRGQTAALFAHTNALENERHRTIAAFESVLFSGRGAVALLLSF